MSSMCRAYGTFCCQISCMVRILLCSFALAVRIQLRPWFCTPDYVASDLLGCITGCCLQTRFSRSRASLCQIVSACVFVGQVQALPADCSEHFLEPFLQQPVPSTHPGFCRAPPAWRSMLYTVGCPHPMSRYIKVPLFSTVEKLVQGEQLPMRDVSLLQRKAPLLHEFLRNYLAAGLLPCEVRELLSEMLKVARRAVIPQQRRNTIPPVLQRARQQQQQVQGQASQTAGECVYTLAIAICSKHRHHIYIQS